MRYFLILLISLYCMGYLHASSLPSARHLTAEYNFAHFSFITERNKWLFPQYALTKPLTFELLPGEALWIPKKWWHWVVSDPQTIAISYWCKTVNQSKNKNMPYKLQMPNENLHRVAKEELRKKCSGKIWHSETDTMIDDDISHPDSLAVPNRCIITLPGYNNEVVDPMKKNNLALYSKLRPHIPHPAIDEWKGREADVDINLWMALGRHDTGLHYDDNDGLLQVLQGRKHVRLFSPSQTPFLAKRCIIPSWAKQTPLCVAYNKHVFYGPLSSKHTLPSARLLYESMLAMNNNAAIMEVHKTTTDSMGNYVWGCKWHGGEMRWELYIYQYDMETHAPRDARILLPYRNHSVKLYGDSFEEPLVIASFDLFNRGQPLGTIIHLYYSKQGWALRLPFRGYGRNITMPSKDISHESEYIYDSYDSFQQNFNEHMESIGVAWQGKRLERLLDAYVCEEICIFNKSADTFFVLYINISIKDFVRFLDEHKYPEGLVNHVKSNIKKYYDIRHEIAIVYDINTLEPVRTAFYGIV